MKREKIYDILTLLRGVVDGRKKLHIFVNVHRDNLPKLLERLPALKKPTIAPLSDENWYSVNTVIDKDQFLEILPVLRRLAQGLVVYEPRQVLPLEEISTNEVAETCL
jgi:ATP phosphoribosyltransferase